MTTEEIIETLEKSRKETAERIKVLQAFVDGKAIEERRISFDHTEWVDNNNPEWRWDKFDYRIKPEPKCRPFNNARECWEEMQKHQPFGWVKCKDDSTTNKFMFICDISDKDATFNNCIEFTYDDFLEDYVFADGTPFGVLE